MTDVLSKDDNSDRVQVVVAKGIAVAVGLVLLLDVIHGVSVILAFRLAVVCAAGARVIFIRADVSTSLILIEPLLAKLGNLGVLALDGGRVVRVQRVTHLIGGLTGELATAS